MHLAILGSVPALAAVLVLARHKFPGWAVGIRWTLASLLAVSAISYFGSFAAEGFQMFPGHLPLDLCDICLWVVIAALVTQKPAIFDVAYYWALAGTTMALLTPNLTDPSRPIFVLYFTDHGLIVASVLYLVWSGQARPRPGSIARSMVAINLYAVVAGTFDFLFKADYMYLCTKPQRMSLLDVMGPWPWYIVAGEVVGLGLFWLLYLPFRRDRRSPAVEHADEGFSVYGQEMTEGDSDD